MYLLKMSVGVVLGTLVAWLTLWALTFTACVGTYHSSACSQDLTSRVVFSIIKK